MMNFGEPVTVSQVQTVGAVDQDLVDTLSPIAVPYDSGVEDYPDAGPFLRVR